MFNENSIQEICNYIENEYTDYKLFKWVDGESIPEELLMASDGYVTYLLINEEEYNLLFNLKI